ncbi:VPLPA-CTERM sorting domain-containing protein [Actibacterium ureilyticum]|uniref:VPLPA-CTERM sorting domain-containing protein n=1 Tax=Actibacterium ureilyticum TaxID=1590614 RepID=UPI0011410457|nr:VPLPA-CTERM sorting domain-containing protein [Actibacterium ureilyticum]
MFVRNLIAGAAIAMAGTAASAATVTTSFFIGAVTGTSNNTNTFDFNQFLSGERVKVEISIDDSALDTAAYVNTGMFADPTATIKLVGATSGTTLTLADGLSVVARNDGQSLKIDSIETSASATNTFVLHNAMDFVYGLPTFSDPNDLSAVLADAELPLGKTGLTSISFWDSTAGRQFTGLRITAVPLPATGLALIGALGVLGLYRRRKS